MKPCLSPSRRGWRTTKRRRRRRRRWGKSGLLPECRPRGGTQEGYAHRLSAPHHPRHKVSVNYLQTALDSFKFCLLPFFPHVRRDRNV